VQPWASCSHTCASVTKQCNLVPASGRWCSATGKVTAGLAESNGGLRSGLRLRSPVGWLTRIGMILFLPLNFTPSSSCHQPPPSSPLAPIISRMETFWYRLTQVYLENGR